jgi:hypothetical protein
MGSLLWIKEAGGIDPKIQTTQKILILETIWIYYNYYHQNEFFWNTCEYKSCRQLRELSRKCRNTRIWVRMSEIWTKYWTGQRQFRTRQDDMMQKDLISRYNTQTKLRTWPKSAIWLWLGYQLNKTSLKIKFVKAQHKGYRTAERWSMNVIFVGFSVDSRYEKQQLNKKRHDNNSRATWNLTPLNEKLGPDLPRGRGKSIGGDLDVDDECSEQNFKPFQSLHHRSVGYQSVRHELTSPRTLIPASAIENTSKNEEDTIWIVDEWLSSQVGVLQTVKTAKLFLTY